MSKLVPYGNHSLSHLRILILARSTALPLLEHLIYPMCEEFGSIQIVALFILSVLYI